MNTPMTDMPNDEAERQQREIETTRADMGRTLERIEDRVSPARIKERQADRVRGRWTKVKESVMGADDNGPSPTERVSEMTDDARETVQQAPERVEQATRGNPIAAGLIAAGVGALAGSLIPSSGPERRLGGELRDEFEEPVRSELKQAGQHMGEELRDHAQESAEQVRSTAQDGAERTRDEALDSADRVRDEAESAAQETQPPGQRF